MSKRTVAAIVRRREQGWSYRKIELTYKLGTGNGTYALRAFRKALKASVPVENVPNVEAVA